MSATSTMRAVLVKDGKGPASALYISDTVQRPVPKAGQVLVKVKAFGLNRMDISQREGNYPIPPGASEILGVEFSGTVEEAGPPAEAARAFQVGDAVLGLVGGGAYAEYVLADHFQVWPKPTDLSWIDAAAIPENWITAYQALDLASFKAGDAALIHTGASGVGVAANQLCRAGNAKLVITTASTSSKLDWLLSLPNGPTHAVNYREHPNWQEDVAKITDGKGVDVVIDFPGQSHFGKNLQAMGFDGRMTMLALMSGGVVKGDLDISHILRKRLRIQGSTLRARSAAYRAELFGKFQKDVMGRITGEKGDGPLKVYIHKVYSFEHIQEAHRDMESNGTSGKLIVTI